jgi:hypothetical protein
VYVRGTINDEDESKRVALCSGDGFEMLYGTGAGKDKESNRSIAQLQKRKKGSELKKREGREEKKTRVPRSILICSLKLSTL